MLCWPCSLNMTFESLLIHLDKTLPSLHRGCACKWILLLLPGVGGALG